jgi:outer membrane lipoprotein-sorting protein
MRGFAAIATLGGLLLAAAPLRAAPLPPAPLSAEDKALVDQATAYLQGLGQMKGRFEQTDARGTVTHGDLFLSRPGRARFAYDPPSNLLVISNGHAVSVADPRLKTISSYPLGATPLALFLARDVRLDRGVVVTQVLRYSDGYALTAVDAHHQARGEITLTFGTDPVRLREWSMIDAQGRTTRVKLTEFEPTTGLDPSLFVGPEPYALRDSAP